MLIFVQSFAKKDLPKEHRVVEHGSVVAMDHNPDRLVAVLFVCLFGNGREGERADFECD